MSENTEVFESRETVRKRPAMYIGSTGFWGFNYLLKKIIQNLFCQTECNHFEIEIVDKLSGKIVFYNLQSSIKDSINEDLRVESYEFAVLNTLCKNYQFSIYDKNSKLAFRQIYEKGILKKGKVEQSEIFAEKIEILFTIDDSVLDFEKINVYFLNETIRELAFLFSNKKFEFKYFERGEKSRIVYNFENGLLDRLQFEKNWADARITNYSKKEFQDYSMELALGLSPFYYTEKLIASYVNFSRTADHGTHVIGLIKGIKKGLKAYFKKHFPDKQILIRNSSIKKYLFAAIHIQIEKPTFRGSTTGSLQTREIIKPISKYVAEIVLRELEKDPKITEDIIRHFE